MFIYGGLTEGAQDNNDDVRDDAYVLNFGGRAFSLSAPIRRQ